MPPSYLFVVCKTLKKPPTKTTQAAPSVPPPPLQTAHDLAEAADVNEASDSLAFPFIEVKCRIEHSKSPKSTYAPAPPASKSSSPPLPLLLKRAPSVITLGPFLRQAAVTPTASKLRSRRRSSAPGGAPAAVMARAATSIPAPPSSAALDAFARGPQPAAALAMAAPAPALGTTPARVSAPVPPHPDLAPDAAASSLGTKASLASVEAAVVTLVGATAAASAAAASFDVHPAVAMEILSEASESIRKSAASISKATSQLESLFTRKEAPFVPTSRALRAPGTPPRSPPRGESLIDFSITRTDEDTTRDVRHDAPRKRCRKRAKNRKRDTTWTSASAPPPSQQQSASNLFCLLPCDDAGDVPRSRQASGKPRSSYTGKSRKQKVTSKKKRKYPVAYSPRGTRATALSATTVEEGKPSDLIPATPAPMPSQGLDPASMASRPTTAPRPPAAALAAFSPCASSSAGRSRDGHALRSSSAASASVPLSPAIPRGVKNVTGNGCYFSSVLVLLASTSRIKQWARDAGFLLDGDDGRRGDDRPGGASTSSSFPSTSSSVTAPHPPLPLGCVRCRTSCSIGYRVAAGECPLCELLRLTAAVSTPCTEGRLVDPTRLFDLLVKEYGSNERERQQDVLECLFKLVALVDRSEPLSAASAMGNSGVSPASSSFSSSSSSSTSSFSSSTSSSSALLAISSPQPVRLKDELLGCAATMRYTCDNCRTVEDREMNSPWLHAPLPQTATGAVGLEDVGISVHELGGSNSAERRFCPCCQGSRKVEVGFLDLPPIVAPQIDRSLANGDRNNACISCSFAFSLAALPPRKEAEGALCSGSTAFVPFRNRGESSVAGSWSCQPRAKTFKLVAFSHHVSDSASRGHFVTYLWDSSRSRWLLIDDERVSVVEAREVLCPTSSGYVPLYELTDDEQADDEEKGAGFPFLRLSPPLVVEGAEELPARAFDQEPTVSSLLSASLLRWNSSASRVRTGLASPFSDADGTAAAIATTAAACTSAAPCSSAAALVPASVASRPQQHRRSFAKKLEELIELLPDHPRDLVIGALSMHDDDYDSSATYIVENSEGLQEREAEASRLASALPGLSRHVSASQARACASAALEDMAYRRQRPLLLLGGSSSGGSGVGEGGAGGAQGQAPAAPLPSSEDVFMTWDGVPSVLAHATEDDDLLNIATFLQILARAPQMQDVLDVFQVGEQARIGQMFVQLFNLMITMTRRGTPVKLGDLESFVVSLYGAPGTPLSQGVDLTDFCLFLNELQRRSNEGDCGMMERFRGLVDGETAVTCMDFVAAPKIRHGDKHTTSQISVLIGNWSGNRTSVQGKIQELPEILPVQVERLRASGPFRVPFKVLTKYAYPLRLILKDRENRQALYGLCAAVIYRDNPRSVNRPRYFAYVRINHRVHRDALPSKWAVANGNNTGPLDDSQALGAQHVVKALIYFKVRALSCDEPIGEEALQAGEFYGDGFGVEAVSDAGAASAATEGPSLGGGASQARKRSGLERPERPMSAIGGHVVGGRGAGIGGSRIGGGGSVGGSGAAPPSPGTTPIGGSTATSPSVFSPLRQILHVGERPSEVAPEASAAHESEQQDVLLPEAGTAEEMDIDEGQPLFGTDSQSLEDIDVRSSIRRVLSVIAKEAPCARPGDLQPRTESKLYFLSQF